MKTTCFILLMLSLTVLDPLVSKGQNVGNWTFNNILTGTGTSSNTVSAVTLGSAIITGAYNGGTVYFGEDGWPTGALDPNAYLQFSLTPNSGKLLSLTYLAMEIRRSTTGTPVGSGPTKWSLRSSLDGYAVDIASGTLTTNSTPATTVSLPTSFLNRSSSVSFRLYGYNTVITSGGLNRFVYDNISVAGTVILPVLIRDFQAVPIEGGAVKLSWSLTGDEPASWITLEKSYNASDFFPIKNFTPQTGIEQNYSFADATGSEGHTKAYFRVKWISQSGMVSYSDVQSVTYNTGQDFTVITLPVGNSANLQVLVKTERSGDFHFAVYGSDGNSIALKTVSLGQGTQSISVVDRPLRAGLYVMITEHEGRKISSKILIP
jgi:hypothetical protein